MDDVRIYRSRPKLIGRIVVSLAMLLMFALAAQSGENPTLTQALLGWGGAVLFAIAAAASIRHLVDARPVLVLDNAGLSGPGLDSVNFVPWSTIHSVARLDRLRRGVLITVEDRRLEPEQRDAMGIRQDDRDGDGRLRVRINVVELAIGRDALGRLIAERVQAAEQNGAVAA